jgi:hypothetical protein
MKRNLKKAITKINEASIQPIPPLFNEPSITTLTQQLNNLIDRYNTIYSIYAKPYFSADPENNPALRLAKVLEDIEKVIDALCLRILKNNQSVT